MKNFFTNKNILGMIHLSGSNPVERALKEIEIYIEEGVHGFIVENYHSDVKDVINVLEELHTIDTRNTFVGLNILPNEYELSFELANRFNIDFIQLDFVAGRYKRVKEIDVPQYINARRKHYHRPLVLGGVWPKYYTPVDGSDLATDIIEALPRCEGIVVTGAGTGKETPLDKINQFKTIIGDNKLLIVGAGVDITNVKEQLTIADGAIIGSCFKPYKMTQEMVKRELVREFMDEVNKII